MVLTSTGTVSPGKTKTESPTRMSSVDTLMHIASEQSTSVVEEFPSDGVITSREWEEINDCQNRNI